MKYEEEFIAWLYQNYTIYNGETLGRYLEDGFTYETFLNEVGLTDDTW